MHVIGVEADANNLRRMHGLGGALMDLDQLGVRWDAYPRFAPMVVADEVARHLMTENQRVGTRAVEQTERYARVAGMNETALPFHQHDVVAFRALEHELLRGTRDEVGHDGVHRNAPPFDENSRLTGRDETRLVTALHERVSQLQLRGHLPDIAVGTDREDDQRVDFRGATIGDWQIRGWPARIENADAMGASELPELGIVTDEAAQPAPDLELALDRGPEPRLPLLGQPPPPPGHAHQDGGRALALRAAALEVSDDGHPAAETQHVLDGLPRLLAIEDRHDALGEVANARVRGLGGQRPELTVGDDENTMLWCASH